MILYSLIFVIPMAWVSATDLPCAARSFTNKSVVCVCTEDYCDTVTRETPVSGQYYAYTSSLGGQRFNKTNGTLQACDDDVTYDVKLTLNTNKTYQTIIGFGGAVSDAAAINWANMSTQLMASFIESYCGPTGLEYNILRVPIGGTDFSTRAYAYNLLPVNDTTLSNFTLSDEDYNYKIPLIKACMAASNTSINILTSLWSPPPWMKVIESYNNFNYLRSDCYDTLTSYYIKFLEAYKAENITIWGTTLTNEPVNGITSAHDPNSLGWTIDQMGYWLTNSFGPTLLNSSDYSDIKIFANDDNRDSLNLYYNLLLRKYPKAWDYIYGVAIHCYTDKNISASIVQNIVSPKHPILNTEYSIIPASMGETPVVIVDYGSWTRAERYIHIILENLNYNSSGWVDWNLALNEQGGPSWLNHKLDAAVIVNATAGEFYKQPMFYIMGHFAKFIPPGSTRIHVTEATTSCASCSCCTSCNQDVEHVAFLTPSNNIVVVLYNWAEEGRIVSIRLDDIEAVISLDANTISTVEFPC